MYRSKLCLTVLLANIFFLSLCLAGYAVELNDVYKNLGTYRVTSAEGLRVYFPESASDAMPRVIDRLSEVRRRFDEKFPEQKGFEAKVILTDHDDRVSSSSDPDFDWINLGMFEEIGALSTRAYSLEKRFALRLSNILLLRTLASASNSWKRKLGTLAMPQWFLDGLTLHNAFPLDSIHFSRLLDMARNQRLYNLEKLNTIVSQSTLIKEEMRFQAHSMLTFWETKLKEGGGIELMRAVMKRPASFEKHFRRVYGISLNEAFKKFRDHVESRCREFKDRLECAPSPVEEKQIGGQFFRSLRYLSPDEKIWVSSKRYSTETYDLYYQKSGKNPKILLKNVHPLLFVDSFTREIFIGKYWVNNQKQRRLGLYSVTPEGKRRCLVNAPGSFKPLGKKFGRIFFTSIKSGITRIMSVDPEFKNSTRVEFSFPPAIRPLDVALSKSCRDLYYVYETSDFKKRLAVISIRNDDKEIAPVEIFSSQGDIRALVFIEDRLWFAAEKDFFTTQLFSVAEDEKQIFKHSSLPGGVWDLNVNESSPQVVTLMNGGFWPTTVTEKQLVEEIAGEPVILAVKELQPVKSHVYKSEYNTSYWKPILSEDEEGFVFGIYSYRTDKLDRSSIVVAPKYGFESRNWGYEAAYTQRFGLFKVRASIVDEVKEKSYLSNDYFERTRSKVLDLEYPLNLSTTLSLGMDLTKRGIAKIPENGNPYPTVGRDHSFYAKVNHRAIRTEPYWEVFPRKGRTITAYYKRGNEFLDGELNYDSMGIRWSEHLPLRNNWVLTGRTWLAEDDKENNIRRPDDLSLGGGDFLRAFDSAFKSGDSLRAFSLHLGRPVAFQFPRLMSWIYNEFLVAEIFAEAGDVRTGQNFRFLFDRGIELRSQCLLFRRIPIRFQVGMAWQNGGDESNTFFAVEVSDLSEIFQ
ncbi:MAG: hypothetical protein PWR01_3030 [Clostridiales bacterium]|jgi:hypothetical protein|nr:hypothetical protein [Clostridiales bacterium]MDN5281957.1 hypothetical protein [Candidatus Ozemobacter sp.]